MNNSYLTLIILICSPLILMVFHILFVRITKLIGLKLSLQLYLFLCILFLNIPLVLIVYLLCKTLSSIVYSLIVYNCIGYCYFHLFNMSETARRIKILLEVLIRKSILKEELGKYYLAEKMVTNRLKRLIDLKQIKQEGNRYFLTGKILLVGAMFMYLWRKVLGFNENYSVKEVINEKKSS